MDHITFANEDSNFSTGDISFANSSSDLSTDDDLELKRCSSDDESAVMNNSKITEPKRVHKLRIGCTSLASSCDSYEDQTTVESFFEMKGVSFNSQRRLLDHQTRENNSPQKINLVDNQSLPSVDELLKIPVRNKDGLSMDDILEKMDNKIAQRKRNHVFNMEKIDADIKALKHSQKERRECLYQNSLMMQRFKSQLTEDMLQQMFSDNLQYLRDIDVGLIYSWRHDTFYKSYGARQNLLYNSWLHSITDEQLEWTRRELAKVWMETKEKESKNRDYVWKVLLPECVIKLYVDFFGISKENVEKLLSETPSTDDEAE